MAQINMTPIGGKGTDEDEFLVCEGLPGIKKCVYMVSYMNGTRFIIYEFPQIGKSLPAVLKGLYFIQMNITAIYEIGVVEGEVLSVSVGIIEYGGQPDPDYFNITGVDEKGNPVYVSEE